MFIVIPKYSCHYLLQRLYSIKRMPLSGVYLVFRGMNIETLSCKFAKCQESTVQITDNIV